MCSVSQCVCAAVCVSVAEPPVDKASFFGHYFWSTTQCMPLELGVYGSGFRF